MPQKQPQKNELKWLIPEYPQYDRGFKWYLIASILGATLLIYCVINSNFLFAVIIFLGVLTSLFSTFKKPELAEFKLTQNGASIGEVFYPWENFQSYWTVSGNGVNNLGLDLKNFMKTDLYIPVNKFPMAEVEKFVSKFLKKNPDRKEEPFSYFLARKLKI